MSTSNIESETTMIGRKALARLTGFRDSTLKFYSEEGLLPYYQAESGLARRYDSEKAVVRLQDIRNLRALGLNINQIKQRLVA